MVHYKMTTTLIIIGIAIAGIWYYMNYIKSPFSPFKIEPYNNMNKLYKKENYENTNFTPFKIEPYNNMKSLYKYKTEKKNVDENFNNLQQKYTNKMNELKDMEKLTISDLQKKKIRDEIAKIHSGFENERRKHDNNSSDLLNSIKREIIKENLEDPEYTVTEEDRIQYQLAKGPPTNSNPSKKYIGQPPGMATTDIRGIPSNLADRLRNDPSMGINPFQPGQLGLSTRLDVLASGTGTNTGGIWG